MCCLLSLTEKPMSVVKEVNGRFEDTIPTHFNLSTASHIGQQAE